MSDSELDDFRAAYQHLLKARNHAPPSDDELAALVTGELSGEERERVIMEMLKSPAAIEKHRILTALNQEAQTGQRPRRRWYQGFAAAAALVLAASLWIFTSSKPPDVQRSGGSNAVVPSGNVALRAAPSEFQWADQPGARQYRVSLFSNAGDLLWQSDWVTTSELSLSADSGAPLHSSARYFWTVETDGAGARETLGPYWFRLE